MTLTFDADIKDGLNLDESGFEVLIDGETYAPTDASRSTSANNQLVLTLSADITAITDDHEVIVNYTGNDLVDISDNEFAQFAKRSGCQCSHQCDLLRGWNRQQRGEW